MVGLWVNFYHIRTKNYYDIPLANTLKLSDDSLKSIGFEKFAKSNELVLPLLTPTTFLIVNILQINYFNKPWFDLTEIKPM